MLKNEISNIEMKNKEDDVFYCEHCFSLKIIMIPRTVNCYCGECGNTDIVETDINLWEELYTEEYGRRYLDVRKADHQGIPIERGQF
jgi:hypothetical protein